MTTVSDNTEVINDLNKSRLGRAEKTEAQLEKGQGMKRKRRSVDKKTDNSLQVLWLARGSKAVGNGWKG